jgi:hypothetical protein
MPHDVIVFWCSLSTQNNFRPRSAYRARNHRNKKLQRNRERHQVYKTEEYKTKERVEVCAFGALYSNGILY